jgi:ribosome recycling factor
METVKKDAEERMKKTLKALKDEFNTIRTGRASASLFDKVNVEYYGTPTPLNQVANISIPEARLIVIQPFDKNALGDIEKAIQTSELSLNPNNDGKVIRINIPPLTEERRKELVKQAKNIGENSRVSIRNIRRDTNDAIKKGEFTEDEQKKGMDEIQKLTDQYIKDIGAVIDDKEKEIMEI